jgi:hypothetical protein
MVDRAHAMLEQRANFRGHAGHAVRLNLIAGQRRRFEKRNGFVEDADVAGRPHVFGDGVGEPQQVVGAAGTEAAAGRLMPPVLHVALHELSPRRAQQMLARQFGPRQRQRQDILQLIAKSVRAAGLVIAAARPEPARDRLIQEPAVHQRVE